MRLAKSKQSGDFWGWKGIYTSNPRDLFFYKTDPLGVFVVIERHPKVFIVRTYRHKNKAFLWFDRSDCKTLKECRIRTLEFVRREYEVKKAES